MGLGKEVQFICKAGKAAMELQESCLQREGVSIPLHQTGDDDPSGSQTQLDCGWDSLEKGGMSQPHFGRHFGLKDG